MSESESTDVSTGAGYKRPPAASRFAKGRSGNPKGRPRGRHREVPYHSVLGQMVTVREDGRERRVTAAEAFLLQLTRKGLMGDSAAARASLAAIEAARAGRAEHAAPTIMRVVFVGFGIGCILRTLGLAVKRYPLDEQRVHWLLEPGIVQAALDRFGVRRLSPDEQREVWKVTRAPEKVQWPEWWSERG
ncbi:DUF5681 domain-containing protein [Novosphingobium sp. MW5]|nr:DUF5681 domain-containing protein [Novosphingobium sp. MW5]